MPAQVILAFANDTSDSLAFLDRENQMVYNYLNRMDNTIVNAVQKKGVTIDELFTEFANKKKDIVIFHFSGHAGKLDLMFNDGRIVSGEGIAQLMKHAPQIELVFLNGCATKDLIDSFHAAGVKRVIATSKKVYDDVASEFAIKFYLNLSQFYTVGEAFEDARAYVVAAKKESPKDEVNLRHIATGVLKENAGDDFPYSIYYKPIIRDDGSVNTTLKDYEKYDEWKFEEVQDPIEVPYSPCIELLKCIGEKGQVLVNFLRRESPNATEEIKEYISLYNEYNTFIRGSQDINHATNLNSKVISILPRPLGILMRQMFSSAKDTAKNSSFYYSELLKYQLRFYDVMVKFSCFAMLSDLYEVIQKRLEAKKDLFFDRKTHEDIIRLLSMEEKDAINFNYRELIKNIRQKIIDNEGVPFIGEYMGAGNHISDNDLEMAHEIIKIKKIQYASNKLKNGLISHCKAVEDELCNIFKEVYFIMRYNLLVIRNVEAIRTRFEKKRTYQHRIMLLRLSLSTSNPEYDITNEGEFTENYSVILVKGLNSIIDYLSLSPFILDKCVLTNDDSSELFYYSYSDNGVLVYEGIEDASRKIEIEIKTRQEEELDNNGNPVLTKVTYVPYVEELARKDTKLNKGKVALRLMMVHEQFRIFQKEIKKISYKVK